MVKPSNMDEYRAWFKEQLNIDLTDREQNHYGQVVLKMRADLEKSALWQDLLACLPEFNDKYRLERGYDLFVASPVVPMLLTKPYDSFLHKTFRKNVLANDRWPGPPKNGWIKPDNWFTRINDVLRTLLVVKYLDGVEYLSDAIGTFCNNASVQQHVDFEAKEEGYYAAHIYITKQYEIPQVTWDTQQIQAQAELQITTQLQESIRRLLHHYYEARRTHGSTQQTQKWQWNYKSDEFAANYLGHILHYVEAMILEIRDKQEGKKP